MEQGIKSVWVFDGKPPEIKSEELKEREALKKDAEEKKISAEEAGDGEEEVKQAKRSLRITPQMIDEAKALLTILGVPFIQAKGEAEAQCAVLNKLGKVDGVASEDMDSLAYGGKTLLRKFKNSKNPVIEISLEKALSELGLNHDQFIDLCILCGSDYTSSIKGIGPMNALKYIKKYGNLETALGEIQNTISKAKTPRFVIPKNYNFVGARKTFKNPDLLSEKEINIAFKNPNFEDLEDFLLDNKILSAKRVDSAINRMKGKGKVTKKEIEPESFDNYDENK